MSEPDRFARVVDGIWLGDSHKRALWEKACIRLLRAEHKAVVRLVTRQATFTPSNMDEEMIPFPESQWIDRDDLLNALARRMQ